MKRIFSLISLTVFLAGASTSFADEVAVGVTSNNTTSSTLSAATTTETTDTTDTIVEGTESCTWFQILTGNCK